MGVVIVKNMGFLFLLGLFPALAAVTVCEAGPIQESGSALSGHVPGKAISKAAHLGHFTSSQPVSLMISLPMKNSAKFQDLLKRLYDPKDKQFGKFISASEFQQNFAPAQADCESVATHAKSFGLSVKYPPGNCSLISVQGQASDVERAYGVSLHLYQRTDKTTFYAPQADPVLPSDLAQRITAVVGLDTSARFHHHALKRAKRLRLRSPASATGVGTGPLGGLAPANIKTVYGLNGMAATGSGQVLGLFELDGYKASDIDFYANYFGLSTTPLQNVLVGGYSGVAGSGSDEVTLDIELQLAIANGAAKIIVYEGPNSSAGVLATYGRIATDNIAKSISTSWGASEDSSTASFLASENTIFQQMAAQGQSIFAAAGDSGAYDNGSSLSVDDPASQPYVVGVGGTTLVTNPDGTYDRESVWNSGSASAGAGGGGISSVWAIPSWQVGAPAATSDGSATKRNVPDVSLNADPYTGYSIYVHGAWSVYGGTSCAAPIWSAFAALVNQQRLAAGQPPLGFPNPLLYQTAAGAKYTTDFHDINDGSTNLHYHAVTGFDDATGWGSFQGMGLLADLSLTVLTPVAPGVPTGLLATASSGQVSLSWNASFGAASYNVKRSTVSGGPYATISTGSASTFFVDNLVSNGTPYFYVVSAVNSVGESGNSFEVRALPQVSSAPPNAPTQLRVSSGSRQLLLRWAQSGSSGVVSTKIYRSTRGASGFINVATVRAATTYTDSSVRAGVIYTYYVRAVNGSGIQSSPSNLATGRLFFSRAVKAPN